MTLKKNVRLKARTARELKEQEERRVLKLGIRRKVKQEVNERYHSFTKEQRQTFVRVFKAGNTIKEAQEKSGIDDTWVVCEVIKRNSKEHRYTVLNDPEDVK